MTDEQIIKALECCATDDGDDCSQCPYGNIVYKSGNGGCVNRCRKDALDLVNRQKAEIDMLQDENWLLKEQLDNAERLNYDMRDEIDVKLKVIDKLYEQIKTIKSEAIKEFAERLKKEALNDSGFEVLQVVTIDNLVKEMTEVQE